MINRLQFLIEQIRETRDFTNRLISEIPRELWFEIPEHTDMNFAWQIRSIEEGIYPATQLHDHFDLIQQITLELLDTFPENKLDDPLEPIPLKHPLATTKYEALSWSFKHEMWHCAEMEMVKRLIGRPIKWV